MAANFGIGAFWEYRDEMNDEPMVVPLARREAKSMCFLKVMDAEIQSKKFDDWSRREVYIFLWSVNLIFLYHPVLQAIFRIFFASEGLKTFTSLKKPRSDLNHCC